MQVKLTHRRCSFILYWRLLNYTSFYGTQTQTHTYTLSHKHTHAHTHTHKQTHTLTQFWQMLKRYEVLLKWKCCNDPELWRRMDERLILNQRYIKQCAIILFTELIQIPVHTTWFSQITI